jgi:hypothetical protein
MKAAILTMFNGLSKTYSLVNVVEEQLGMLLEAGIEVKLLVSQDCPDAERYGIYRDDRIEWVKVANRYQGEQIHWRDYSTPAGTVHDTFFAEADTIAGDFIRHLSDTDVCLMHDILYQGWHLVHNVAIRKAQPLLPHVRFLAFTHSLPVNRPAKTEWPFSARFLPMPHTTYVYPTGVGLEALALQYGTGIEDCRHVNNSLDVLAEASGDVKLLAAKTDLLSPDILIIYPGRLSAGKQFNKAAALAGAICSASQCSVRLICCDFPSLDTNAEHYKSVIKAAGMQQGLAEEDVVFTSDLGWKDGFPHRGVLQLFRLSNLFICSSFSESFGLIVLEAASGGNFLVLNQAVPALEELGIRLQAYFMRWDARNMGYDTRESYYPSEGDYLKEHALHIVEQMKRNPVLNAKTLVRQCYSPGWIWRNQLEPLIRGDS